MEKAINRAGLKIAINNTKVFYLTCERILCIFVNRKYGISWESNYLNIWIHFLTI